MGNLPIGPIYLLIQAFVYISINSLAYIFNFGLYSNTILFILLLKLFYR